MRTQDLGKSSDLATTNGTAELEARVQYRLSGRIRDFQLEVGEKGLILRGCVHTYYYPGNKDSRTDFNPFAPQTD